MKKNWHPTGKWDASTQLLRIYVIKQTVKLSLASGRRRAEPTTRLETC